MNPILIIDRINRVIVTDLLYHTTKLLILLKKFAQAYGNEGFYLVACLR